MYLLVSARLLRMRAYIVMCIYIYFALSISHLFLLGFGLFCKAKAYEEEPVQDRSASIRSSRNNAAMLPKDEFERRKFATAAKEIVGVFG